MAAVHHHGYLKKAFHTSGDPMFSIHTKFGKDILMRGRDATKSEFETTPSDGKILLPVPISTRVFL